MGWRALSLCITVAVPAGAQCIIQLMEFNSEEDFMKKIVFIVCALLVLAAGAGIGYKFTRMTVKMNPDSDTVVYQKWIIMDI